MIAGTVAEGVAVVVIQSSQHEDVFAQRFQRLQNALLLNPAAGDLIQGTGGLRKMRFADPRRGKGKRGGLRVIYFWWVEGMQFWLFTLYDKDEASDLTPNERKLLRERIKQELSTRTRR